MRCFRVWWWLRSTTGSYGRPEIDAAYGEIVISLHRGCLGDVSSGKVVGVSTWCITHGRHTRVNTSVDTVYVFLIFNKKIYTYYVFKYLYVLWKDTGGPWRCLGSMTIRERFWPPMLFFLKKWKIYRFIVVVSLNLKLIYIFVYIYSLLWFHVQLIVMSVPHWAYGLLTLLLFPFYRLVVILLYRTAVVKISLPHRSLIR